MRGSKISLAVVGRLFRLSREKMKAVALLAVLAVTLCVCVAVDLRHGDLPMDGGINLDIMPCNTSSPNQQWSINPDKLSHIVLISTGNCMGSCYLDGALVVCSRRDNAAPHDPTDVEGYGTSDGSNVWTYACHPSDKGAP